MAKSRAKNATKKNSEAAAAATTAEVAPAPEVEVEEKEDEAVVSAEASPNSKAGKKAQKRNRRESTAVEVAPEAAEDDEALPAASPAEDAKDKPAEEKPHFTASLEVFSSPAPSAHTVGISAMAMNAAESRVAVAREDGTLAICMLRPNPVRCTAAFIPIVRTGCYEGRTITRLLFALGDTILVASYLSGQIVVYDATTLTILHVAERFGGAIWDMVSMAAAGKKPARTAEERKHAPVTNADGSIVAAADEVEGGAPSSSLDAAAAGSSSAAASDEEELVCACADGSWYHFNLVRSPRSNTFALSLIQVFPKVVGAHRALTVAVCGDVLVGGDDCGNLVAWQYPGKGVRGYTQLWVTRLPKGGYAKAACYDAETGILAAGTSLGDVAFVRADKGIIINTYVNHQGPITSIICAGDRTMLATGWHESLRAYRFVDRKWIPTEVRRRTHYHEASQLLYCAAAKAVIGASRDGTVLIAGLNDNFTVPPKYAQLVPQLYAYAADASVALTVAGNRVEMYQANDTMSRWAPLACYTAHGHFGISGVWCDTALSRVVVATTTRLVVLGCVRKSVTSIALTKIVDYAYANVHSVLIDRPSDIYAVFGMGELAHIAIGGSSSAPSVIESRMALPMPATSVGKLGYENSLVLATSAVGGAKCQKVPLNEDGSFAAQKSEEITNLRAQQIITAGGANIAFNNFRFIDLSTSNRDTFPLSCPADTVFFSKLQRGSRTMYMGFCPRGLLFATKASWWLADEENRRHNAEKAADADSLNRSTQVAMNGPRKTYIAAFNADSVHGERVVALQRDISAEVETLPLMWKVRRFGN